MNKKFSTLLATLLVAGGMSSAFAITVPTANVKTVEAGKAYQLYGGGNILVMTQAADGSYEASFVAPSTVTDLASSLWTISYVDNVVGGPDFTLVNKGTGCPLSVDLSALTTTAAEVPMGGNVSEWKWLAAASSSASLSATYLYSYFKTDSVVCLSYNTGTGALEALKEEATKISGVSNKISIAPATAAKYTLTAKDLNTKFGTDPEGDSFQLSATPELKVGENSTLGNKFTATTFRAWNGNNNTAVIGNETANFELYAQTASGYPLEGTALATTTNGGYVLLQVIDGENDDKYYEDTYFLADTSYIEGTATNLKLIDFGTDKFVTTPHTPAPYVSAGAAKRDIKSYMFKFEYHPTADSLAIFVKGYMDESATPSTTAGLEGSMWQTPAATNKTLVTANRLTSTTELTVLATAGPANIKFMLGEGTTNRTSKLNNVYTITNDKGQYLAVPIQNTPDATAFSGAQWVTLSEQEALNMPAYQWVVLKNNDETPEIAEVSPVDIINREFTDVELSSVQLRQEEGGKYLFVTGNTLGSDSLTFTAVPKAVLENEYLGYMNIEEDELDVMNYNLNYLNPYVADKYIGLNGNDTILTVKEAITSFYFEKGTEEKYGYQADGTEGIDGLVESLVRFQYTPYVKTANGERYIGMDKEDRYFVAPSSTTKKNFYFKENNYYQPEGVEAARPYYALVDLTAGSANNQVSKAGTSDMDMAATLRNQVMSETRTSAFAVVPNDAPLYRRFNTELEDAIEGQEDATKVLKFKEFYRGEYLMDENNEKFQNEGVAYLGIERADKATGLSFYVDTAVLNGTTSGKIKPQYFIYVNPVTVDSIGAKPCDAKNHQHMTADGTPTDNPYLCSHATPAKPGYTVADYVVSFEDSVTTRPAYNADKLYKFGEYTRVGFVKGLHIGDSLYILTNGFEKMAAADLDTADIRANYKATKVEFNIIDLKEERTDAHHNYTWSFRYVDPEAAAAVDEEARRFLIESNVEPMGNTSEAIAPQYAAWLKSQNGCLVLSDPKTSEFDNAKTGGDNALIFNIEVGSEDDMATDNEEISTSEVKVIAGNGQITINGAAGKKVVVSNILGQVVANTVLTSDNATIAAPQGVVVVAVEGEEAVKAIVK